MTPQEAAAFLQQSLGMADFHQKMIISIFAAVGSITARSPALRPKYYFSHLSNAVSLHRLHG